MNATPQWIAKMYPSKVGRDHLGLGSVSSDQILPTLSPEINVLTFHPRYHSFYVFLLDEFWRRDRPQDRKSWIEFFRPREFIFSVGAYLCDRPEHGDMGSVVGGQKTEPLANRQLETYDTSTDYIKNRLGGYGLYYATVMILMGLVTPGGSDLPSPVDIPSEAGKRLAGAFREAVQDTEYYKQYFRQDATHVPMDVIRDYIRHACLCQLMVPETPDRALLLDVFLHQGTDPDSRRGTFRMFLDIASQTDGFPIDQDSFRQILYFGQAETGARYQPMEDLNEVSARWRLYQAREYYAFALNAMWAYLCHWGLMQDGDIRPVPLKRFWEHLATGLDFDLLASRLDLAPPGLGANAGLHSLRQWLQNLIGADKADFDQACGIDAPLHEHHLYRLARENRTAPEVMIAGMITMLTLISLRFGDPALWARPEWEISRMGDNGRLSVDAFLRSILRRRQSGPVTLREITRWLFSDYIIHQHQLIANSKLPDNTFRFRREGDGLRFFNLPTPLGFMDSRFEALSTTVHELGLCGDLASPKHPVTEDGQVLLEYGDLT